MFITAYSLSISLLAQEPAPEGQSNLLQLVMPLFLIFTLYYVMFVLPQRSRDRRLEDLAGSLKTNDHVLTTSGVYGVVTNVQREENRVTLRIDESTGAKMRVTMDSISRVLDDDKDKKDGK